MLWLCVHANRLSHSGSAWAVLGVGLYTSFGLCHWYCLQAMWILLEQNSVELAENYLENMLGLFSFAQEDKYFS